MKSRFLQVFDIELEEFLLGSEDWTFLAETVFRSLIMFIILLSALRVLGKRGVKQLSVFELVVIIGLGSAAGDPMFYKDVGILPAIIVFLMIVTLYKLVTYFVGKSKRFEYLVEGKPVSLISDGRFTIENFEKETLAQDEFFAELRMAQVMHLGQVELAIIESSGNISIFFYPNEEVKYGLPILPDLFEEKLELIPFDGIYSCSFCGYTSEHKATATPVCPVCERKIWVKSINRKRVI